MVKLHEKRSDNSTLQSLANQNILWYIINKHCGDFCTVCDPVPARSAKAGKPGSMRRRKPFRSARVISYFNFDCGGLERNYE
jgi:hypothetical protein